MLHTILKACLLIIFSEVEARCSYKLCSYKKESVYAEAKSEAGADKLSSRKILSIRKLNNLMEQEEVWNSNQLGEIKEDFKSTSKRSETKVLKSKRDIKGAEETLLKVPLATIEESLPDPEDQKSSSEKGSCL